MDPTYLPDYDTHDQSLSHCANALHRKIAKWPTGLEARKFFEVIDSMIRIQKDPKATEKLKQRSAQMLVAAADRILES